jgi:hypothetical protein
MNSGLKLSGWPLGRLGDAAWAAACASALERPTTKVSKVSE